MIRMTPPNVAALADLLQDCPEIGPLFEYGGANYIAAEWLAAHGVVVASSASEAPHD
jgi:hypothetical protein